MAGGIDRTHVDHALQAQQRAGGGGGNSGLTRPGLGNDPGLAHLTGQQCLAEDVVDLVRAGVVEILALEEDARPTRVGTEPGRFIER